MKLNKNKLKTDLGDKMLLQCCELQRRFSFSLPQHRKGQHYVYIGELVTFMERTVTIVTRRSAITGIHRHTHTQTYIHNNRHIR
jgi:hypothetical protein